MSFTAIADLRGQRPGGVRAAVKNDPVAVAGLGSEVREKEGFDYE